MHSSIRYSMAVSFLSAVGSVFSSLHYTSCYPFCQPLQEDFSFPRSGPLAEGPGRGRLMGQMSIVPPPLGCSLWKINKFQKTQKRACKIEMTVVSYLPSAMRLAYPGVAKFGIALEWGSRGRWFESSHSDHKIRQTARGVGLSYFLQYSFCLDARKRTTLQRSHFIGRKLFAYYL